jgi:hypothetical protein
LTTKSRYRCEPVISDFTCLMTSADTTCRNAGKVDRLGKSAAFISLRHCDRELWRAAGWRGELCTGRGMCFSLFIYFFPLLLWSYFFFCPIPNMAEILRGAGRDNIHDTPECLTGFLVAHLRERLVRDIIFNSIFIQPTMAHPIYIYWAFGGCVHIEAQTV